MDKERIKNEIISEYPKKINYKKLLERLISGRRILIWGACERSREVVEFIENMELKGFDKGGYVDSNSEIKLYNSKRCYRPEEINVKTDFIIFALLNRYEDINVILNEKNFFEEIDYLYFFELINHNITISACEGYYCDIYGNEIQGRVDGFSVCFAGINNFLYIGDNCKLKNNLEMHIENGSRVIIDGSLNLEKKDIIEKTVIWTENKALLYIGENCCISNAVIRVMDCSVVKISENFSSMENLFLISGQNSLCYIGKDCMFSIDILLMAADTHNIYDIEKHENINENKNYEIILGDHVWVGARANILYGAKIGNGCIIGMNSFVNKKFPSNTIIAGNPAEIVRENAAWHRDMWPLFKDYKKFKGFDFR